MDLYREIAGDELADLLDNDLELGKFSFGKLIKGVGKVARGALKVAKFIPGVGSIAAVADTGLDVVDKVGGAIGKAKRTARDIKNLGKAAGISVGGKKKPSAAAQKIAARAEADAEEEHDSRERKQSPRIVKHAPSAAIRDTESVSSGGSVEAQAARAEPQVIIQAAPLDVGALVARFSSQISPQLAAIGGHVNKLNLQAKATAEHKQRAARLQFETAVLKRLGARK